MAKQKKLKGSLLRTIDLKIHRSQGMIPSASILKSFFHLLILLANIDRHSDVTGYDDLIAEIKPN